MTSHLSFDFFLLLTAEISRDSGNERMMLVNQCILFANIFYPLTFPWLQIEYPEIEDLTKPRHRFMSSYEQVYTPRHFQFTNFFYSFSLFFASLTVQCLLFPQRIEPFDRRYQYLLFAAEPYEIISFKVSV